MGALLSLIPVFTQLLDKILPDKGAADAAKLELLKMAQQGELAQINADVSVATAQAETNKIEAASASLFIAGARPFIMWVCGIGLAMQFLVAPMIMWGAAIFGKTIVLPSLDMSTLLTLLLGMLGLGGMRTVEKLNGVARK